MWRILQKNNPFCFGFLGERWTPRPKNFDIDVELNHQVERKGYGIVEMRIEYRPRLGEKKLRLRHGLTILKRIVAESLS
jgi:hypothetical protein